MKVSAAASKFISELNPAIGSKHTHLALERDLARLVSYAGSESLAAVKPVHVRSFIVAEHRRGLAATSLQRLLSSWRRFFDALAEQDLIVQNPARGVRAPRAGKHLPAVLSPEEASRLLDAAGTSAGEQAIRDLAMFELAYSSALRVSELVGLDCADVDEEQRMVRIRQGKGNKERLVPIGSKALAALAAWREQRSGTKLAASEDALFVNRQGQRLSSRSAQYRIAKLAQNAGLPSRISPHILRHSCASHMLQSSGDLRAVQEFLGHANIGSTQVYTHLDFQALAQVYDKTHPRARRAGAQKRLQNTKLRKK